MSKEEKDKTTRDQHGKPSHTECLKKTSHTRAVRFWKPDGQLVLWLVHCVLTSSCLQGLPTSRPGFDSQPMVEKNVER